MGLELAKAWIRVSVDKSGVAPALRGLTGLVSKAFSPVGAAISAALGGAAVGALAFKAVGLAAEAEQTAVAFETFLGSAEKAKQVLEDLNKFSTTTPFQQGEVKQAAKVLLAMGTSTKDLIPTLRMLGDISAGTGKNFNELAVIFGKIQADGRVMGEELNQLGEAGIPIIKLLADRFGVAEDQIRKMASEGKIGFDDIRAAFISMTSEGGRFFGLTEKQSQTLSGRISTLKDEFNAILRTLGQALLPVAKTLVEAFSDLAAAVGTWVETHKDSINKMVSDFNEWLKGVIEGGKFLVQNWKAIWSVMQLEASLKLTQILQDASKFYDNMVKNIPFFEAAFGNSTAPFKAKFDKILAGMAESLGKDLKAARDELDKSAQRSTRTEEDAKKEREKPLTPSEAKKAVEEETKVRAGRSDIAGFSRSIQDALLGDMQKKMLDELKKANQINGQIANALTNPNVPKATIGFLT